MNIRYLLNILLLCIFLLGCKKDDEPALPIIGGFEQENYGLALGETSADVTISFTRSANYDIPVTIGLINNGNMEYGENQDYTTLPAAENGAINTVLPANQKTLTIQLTKHREPEFGETKSVVFSITEIDDPLAETAGNLSATVTFAENPVSGGANLSPNVGGNNHQNQVFIDLSKQSTLEVLRNSWDLGFYHGGQHRVILNFGNWSSAMALEKTDLTEVAAADTSGFSQLMVVGSFAPGSDQFVDAVDGDLDRTAFGDLATSETQAKVFIMDLGYDGARTGEAPRGWIKIKVYMSGNNYVVKYGDIDANTFSEVTIVPKSGHSFSHVNLLTGQEVDVTPGTGEWDFVFSPSPSILNFGGLITYPFNHYIRSNRTDGTEVALVDIRAKDNNGEPLEDENGAPVIDEDAIDFDSFAADDISSDTFSADADVIGSSWRSVFPPPYHYDYVYYLIKDADGNIYKLRFTKFTDETSEAGFPEFEYTLIQ